MQNKLFILFLISITTILSSCFSSDDILDRNKEPLAVKYLNFQEVNEQYKSKDFEVKLLYKTHINSAMSPNPIHVFPSVNGNFIVSCDAEESDETQGNMDYFKVDSLGNMKDKFLADDKHFWPVFINEFMVFTNDDKAYFNTWPLNGNTTKRDFKVLNADLKWSGNKISQIIKTVQKENDYWFYNAVSKNEKSYRQFLFYQDKQWQLLWMNWPEYESVNDEESANRYSKDVFLTGKDDPYLERNVSLLHFHKMEKVKYIHAIGGGGQSFDVTNWRGKAFFNTKIGGKDFNFFVPNVAIENESFDGNRDRFYKVENPGYAVNNFSPSFYISAKGFAFYSPDRDQIYLIKAKNEVKITK